MTVFFFAFFASPFASLRETQLLLSPPFFTRLFNDFPSSPPPPRPLTLLLYCWKSHLPGAVNLALFVQI